MKTLAIRLDDEQHAQLSVLAQLEGSTVTDFIRSAISAQVEQRRSQPDIAAKAEQVLADIDADAASRRSAIAGLFAPSEGTPPEDKSPGSRQRRKPTGES